MAPAESADARERRRAGGKVHRAIHHRPHDGVRRRVREDGPGADGRGPQRGDEEVHQAREDLGGRSGGFREASAESGGEAVTAGRGGGDRRGQRRGGGGAAEQGGGGG